MILPYQGLVIYGCGGHARSVADVALDCGLKSIVFVDSQAKVGETLLGFTVQQSSPELPLGWGEFSAQGDNLLRQNTLQSRLNASAMLGIIASNTATVGKDAILGHGTFVGHHAHIGPLTHIGVGCIINTSAVVEHDCVIGDYTHVSVNTTLCGKVRVGQRCFIGAGATLIDGVTLCSDVIIGAGAVVVSDITEPGTYLGVPARKVV